jgi:hypothetical protein
VSLTEVASKGASAGVGDDHCEVGVLPGDPRAWTGIAQPAQLAVHGTRQVIAGFDLDARGGGIARYDDVGEDRAPAGSEPLGNPPEEIPLALRVEVVDGERRDDEVERPGRERMLARARAPPAPGKVPRAAPSSIGALASRPASRAEVSPVPTPSSRTTPGERPAVAATASSCSRS